MLIFHYCSFPPLWALPAMINVQCHFVYCRVNATEWECQIWSWMKMDSHPFTNFQDNSHFGKSNRWHYHVVYWWNKTDLGCSENILKAYGFWSISFARVLPIHPAPCGFMKLSNWWHYNLLPNRPIKIPSRVSGSKVNWTAKTLWFTNVLAPLKCKLTSQRLKLRLSRGRIWIFELPYLLIEPFLHQCFI